MIEVLNNETGELIAAPFLRTPYNYNRNEVSQETGQDFPEPSLTQQQFKEETDINTIVKRFGLTGEIPPQIKTPITEDFVGVTTYHEALTMVKNAEAAFMEMPAHIRAEFRNDPGAFVAFTEDDKNRKRAEELGLVLKRPGVVEPKKETPEVPPERPSGAGVT